MDPFLRMIKEAAYDPTVLTIRITIYRLAKKARLVEYLCAAAENGKEVTVLIELRARFDEQNNIDWSERLEEAGCRVIYGFEGYKVHSKICLITYRNRNNIEYITQVGTGNYNEKTATMYTDVSLITADKGIGEDAAVFFKNMSIGNLNGSYQHIIVSPTSLKPKVLSLMDEEINLLILDEPTNHLDIAAREWIEEAVEAFDGTLLFVSHDRYFIQRFATRIWELADGTITDYPMGFAQYRAVKAQEKAPQPVKAQEKKGDTRPPRGNRSQQAARRQLTICETGISKLEAECRRLDEEMAAHACDAGELNRLYQEKQEVEARLEQEMARWEELSLQIEE